MISRGVWKGQPFEEDVGNTGFSPFQQGEPGLTVLSPLANAQSPRGRAKGSGLGADAG